MDSTDFLTGSVFRFGLTEDRFLPADGSPHVVVSVDVPDGVYAELGYSVSIAPAFEPQDGDGWHGTVDCMWVSGTSGEVTSFVLDLSILTAVEEDVGSFEIAHGEGLILECANNLRFGDGSEPADVFVQMVHTDFKPVTTLTER